MNIFEVNERGEFVKLGSSVKRLVRAIKTAAGKGKVRIPIGWKVNIKNDPEHLGNVIFEIVVPDGNHPTWDNNRSVVNALKASAEIIQDVCNQLLGKGMNIDLNNIPINIGTGSRSNIERSDFHAMLDDIANMAENLTQEVKGRPEIDFSKVKEKQKVEVSGPSSGGYGGNVQPAEPGKAKDETAPRGESYESAGEGETVPR